MNGLGLLARLATAVVALSAVGALVSLALGLLATSSLVAILATLVLVVLAVGGLTALGVGSTDGTETTYW